MVLRTETDIIQLVKKDRWMMDILTAASTLNLPDWWVCAGFVRSKIWDALHHFPKRTPLQDIDVIYFDPLNINESEEKTLERELRLMLPDVPWSVKNEARMHVVNGVSPYSSSEDAISKFPETVTALGLKRSDDGEVILTAPHGIQDVIRMEVRPTPYFEKINENASIYKQRLIKKNWASAWPKVKIISAKKGVF